MLPFTNKGLKSNQDAKVCDVSGKKNLKKAL